MLGKIVSIEGNTVTINFSIDITSQISLVNFHVVFEDGNNKIVGEIKQVDQTTAKIAVVGELINNTFLPGSSKKPSFKAGVRLINIEELGKVLGEQQVTDGSKVYFGLSTVYQNYRINVPVNEFFSNHFAILGNTGSGKSFTVSRLIQNLFSSPKVPFNSNIFIFDAYGEYTNAFSRLKEINPKVNYKVYTTDTEDVGGNVLKIPIWLLDVDDIAHILEVDNPKQLPIIEKALNLVRILNDNNPNANTYRNDLIAHALRDILLSGKDSSKIRDQITAVLSNFSTAELNLNSEIKELGYNRTLKQCLYTDNTGKMQEVEKVISFLNTFIIPEIDTMNNVISMQYTLTDLKNALDLALISEGILKSDSVYDYANVLAVRLHTLVNSKTAAFFEYNEMVSREKFISDLLLTDTGEKAQIVNFNIKYVSDRMAKALTKIITHILFEFVVENLNRGAVPIHILIEEAHRYVQNDKDYEVLGYNIFDRITKEGRKYGILLGLITQRPSELSETSISQCSNFIILKTMHPKDLDFIRNMVPNMSQDIMESLKILQAGSCIAFGNAFNIPISIKFEKANPEPLSNNVDIIKLWYVNHF